MSVDLGTVDMKEYREARKEPIAEPEEKVVEEVATTEEKVVEEKKSRGGFQTKIDRLVKHSALLEEELAKTKKELETKANGKSTEKEVVVAGEPKREDFESDVAFYKAVAKYEVRQEMAEAEKERGRKDAETAHKELVRTYNERAIEAMSVHEDWKEVVNQPINIPGAVVMAILRMENGPDVAYYLGKNPEVCEELMGMDELKAVGRAFELSKEIGVAEVEEEEVIEPEKKRVPAPIKPVGSGSSKGSTIPLDKSPFAAYKKARQAGRVH